MRSKCTILMWISQNFEKRIISVYVHIVKRISFFFIWSFIVKNVHWLPQNAPFWCKLLKIVRRRPPNPHLRDGVTPSPTLPLSAPQSSLRLHWSLVPPAVEVLDPPLIYAKANIHLVWPGVYLHGGVYLHMCKLTFTYMQLRSHAQKYIRVQIINICILIYIPCVNQRMWTGL